LYTELIQTTNVKTKQELSPTSAKNRLENIKRMWNVRSEKDFEQNPNKTVIKLNKEYIEYLGNKLTSLFHKYTTSPWSIKKKFRNAKVLPFTLSYLELFAIFSCKKMSELIDLYYDFLNCRREIPALCTDEEQILIRNIYKMFELIEQEYTEITNKKPHRRYRNKVLKG